MPWVPSKENRLVNGTDTQHSVNLDGSNHNWSSVIFAIVKTNIKTQKSEDAVRLGFRVRP